jgi:hypothetical protein
MKLKRIRQTLFLLWGPLEEESNSKGKFVADGKGVWFETCLKEFWDRPSEAEFGKRRWRLFGLDISD